MPSETPQEDKCGAKVVSKVGLEIHDFETDTVYVDTDVRETDSPNESEIAGPNDDYDEHMRRVVLSDGEHEQECPLTWEDVLPLLREDWHTEAVIVEREDEDAVEHVRVPIEDDDPYVANRGTVLDGFCMRWPSKGQERCYLHHGRKGGTPGDNIKHGLYTERSDFFQWLDEEDQVFVRRMVDAWLEDAPFGRDDHGQLNMLYRLAIDELRLAMAQDEMVNLNDQPGTSSGEYTGLAYERVIGTNDEGEEISVVDESPINLPYSRLSRDTLKGLKELNVIDSPESEQAEADMSIAQALSGEGDN